MMKTAPALVLAFLLLQTCLSFEHKKPSDKEILFGGEMDEDDINQLSDEQQKEKLRSLASKKMDANGDGFVDRVELEAWALKSMEDYETLETKEEFYATDVNSDGHIKWREWVDESYGSDFDEEDAQLENPTDEDWNSFANLFRREKEMFAAADIDDDGQLTMEEFLSLKHPNREEVTSQLHIKHTLEQSDLNGNGVIDLEEYIGEYKSTEEYNEDPEWAIYEKERFTYELDTNKDGVLTGKEILHWVTVDNKEASEDEASHLIGECDRDDDGQLSIEEIISNHLVWIESETTDFGAHLLRNHDEL